MSACNGISFCTPSFNNHEYHKSWYAASLDRNRSHTFFNCAAWLELLGSSATFYLSCLSILAEKCLFEIIWSKRTRSFYILRMVVDIVTKQTIECYIPPRVSNSMWMTAWTKGLGWGIPQCGFCSVIIFALSHRPQFLTYQGEILLTHVDVNWVI
jgi:hypothetical protein